MSHPRCGLMQNDAEKRLFLRTFFALLSGRKPFPSAAPIGASAPFRARRNGA